MGNRRNKFCIVIKNLSPYTYINDSPSSCMKKVVIELAKLLKKLQDNQIVHGDIRPETLISNSGLSRLHLINFNQSRKYSDIYVNPEEYLLQLQYSCWNYLPPEVFQYIYNTRYCKNEEVKRPSLLGPN